MASPCFTLLARDPASSARRGRLHTAHGDVETPIFMPVGTQATVKGLQPRDLRDIGTQILLGNTYYLHLRPTSERIAALGGLHTFMGWSGPILTDSGGFQAFSLAKLCKTSDDGIAFRSHLDGSPVFLGPREVMGIQANLGSDIAMVIDECPPAGCTREVAEKAVERTVRWAGDCHRMATESGFLAKQHVFAIVQGGRFADLRTACAARLAELDFPGYAIGGVSVGEPEAEMLPQVEVSAAALPVAKPRYVMGVGTPPQLLRMIAAGADMFDCVMPSREARHGVAFTVNGRINLKNQRFRDDARPLCPETLPQGHQTWPTRAYIRHLVIAGEMLGGILLTLHNIRFFLCLMEAARHHIESGDFLSWSASWVARYERGSEES